MRMEKEGQTGFCHMSMFSFNATILGGGAKVGFEAIACKLSTTITLKIFYASGMLVFNKILKFKGESIFNVDEKVNDTLIFNTFVLCQVFNVFNARKLEKQNVFKGIHKNKLFLGIVGFTIVLQVVMVEFLKKFADTVNLNGLQWAICIAIAAVSWPIGWIVKFIPVSDKPFLSHLKWAGQAFGRILHLS
ncbi:hypothetical protein AAG906_021286 [Vitis piasezkii]